MGSRRIGGQIALALGVITLAASCVPAPERPATAAPREHAVIQAAPLLGRLQLAVAPADLPPVTELHQAVLAAPAFLDTARSADDASRATECLTAAVYYEARSEPTDGQRAVAQVVLNRVRDRAFPASVCGVVYQGSSRSTGCQFSFACDGSLNRPRDPGAWARARLVAMAALGGDVYAAVGAATHYHATSVLPWWASSLVRLGAIGHHLFYRWADPLERALGFRQRYAGIEPGAEPETAAPALIASGVTIHRASGEAVENGVTVHHGSYFANATTTDSAVRPSPAVYQGVRIHRGQPDMGSGPAETDPLT